MFFFFDPGTHIKAYIFPENRLLYCLITPFSEFLRTFTIIYSKIQIVIYSPVPEFVNFLHLAIVNIRLTRYYLNLD